MCRALADGPRRVFVVDRDGDAARRVAADIGSDRAAAVELDLADADAVATAFADIGRVDVLVNSAAIGLVTPSADADRTQVDDVLAVNLRAVWATCKAVLPGMVERGRGSIVNIGSNHAVATVPGYSVYAATKSALEGLSRGIAADYGRHGVRCNVVHPGLVDSPENRKVVADGFGDADAWLDGWVTRRQMLPYAIEPEDVARVVAFLASDAARAVTAATLVVDAGTSALLIDND